ncbi:hypothetical protein [Chryseolinea soli]|uniref:Uncharacterized protein n=1 Tax=Chryseolinea soli TaxID=2321403 RepID=A0A385SMZ9_9BACT|nr:hypothetical protein [Chryseolinea soli]AYB32374.1 hypothetical protein D4L85_18155 [Chryseolinea soli]
MSIINHTPVELSDIVKESNLIVEVRCIEPFTEEIAIKGDGSGAAIKPFKKKGFVFNVISVLKNTAAIQVPPTIRVPNEEWRRSLNQHKELYANGISKSYGVKQYVTDVPSLKRADILFLHHFQDNFELETQDSFESAAAREKIDMLLAAR